MYNGVILTNVFFLLLLLLKEPNVFAESGRVRQDAVAVEHWPGAGSCEDVAQEKPE